MIVAHVMGIPIEETASQLVPVAAALATVVGVTGRAALGRLRRRATRHGDARVGER